MGLREHPELDMQIVEEVLGWDLDELVREEFLRFRGSNTGIGMSGSEVYDDEKYRDRMLSIVVPCYSGNVESAMQLAVETGLFKKYVLSQRNSGWWIIYTHFRSIFAQSNTIPTVICHAVLRMKGVRP